MTTPLIAHAQSAAGPSEIEAIFACKDETNPTLRLACYDAAAGKLESAQKSGDIVTLSKEQVETVERDSFGFNIPSLPKLGALFGGKSNKKKTNDLTDPVISKDQKEVSLGTEKKAKPRKKEKLKETPRISEISTKIIKTQEFGYKRVRFFLSNGQVWEQAESRVAKVPKIKKGNYPQARIRKAALGSFLMQINERGRAIRVRRVR